MPQYVILLDKDKCVGCQTCVIACKQENKLPVGVQWRQIVEVGPREVDGRLRLDFIHLRCMHCGKAPCISACPQKAITKREDGIIVINQQLCIGYLICVEVCPFMAPQFNPETNTVGICTLCMHRVDRGLEPSCVKHCMTGALRFGPVDEVIRDIRVEKAVRLSR